MINKINGKEDDFLKNRLLLKLEKLFDIESNNMTQINKDVYLLRTKKGTKVVKRYTNKQTLQKQLWITDLLIDAGFTETVTFEKFPDGRRRFKLNSDYFAIMPFIEGESLSYKLQSDRMLAYNHLRKFQKVNKKLDKHPAKNIPTYSLYSKWSNRIDTFYYNLKYYEELIPRSQQKMLSSILKWGDYALSQMSLTSLNSLEKHAQKKLRVIHGDVANHNFLKQDGGSVYLIDYDLLATAPHSYDILQLVNRFMPYMNWSLDELNNYDYYLSELLTKRWFLLALIYPTDIYREWNRICTAIPFNKDKLDKYISLIESGYETRTKLVKDLFSMVK